jgi:uncharacterized protein involved in outer membrane biogenesis
MRRRRARPDVRRAEGTNPEISMAAGTQTEPRQRGGRGLRIALIVLAVLVVAIVGAGAIALSIFDPNSLKPRIVAAVKQATGRDLALNGNIGLKASLWPTIAVRDVAISNPPGFSRPQMATLQELDLQLALLPLLSKRIEVERLFLDRPDVLLETNAQGQPNWQFTPSATPNQTTPAGGATTGEPGSGPSLEIGIRDIEIDNGKVAYRDGKTSRTTALDLNKLTATADSVSAPLHVTADATYNNVPAKLVADTGSLARLQDRSASTPWPVKLSLVAANARLAVDGALTQPMQGKGYTLAVDANVPDLSALTPMLGTGTSLPPLRDVTLKTKLADSGGPIPAISNLALHAGAADLGSVLPGLQLQKADVSTPANDQPVRADLAAQIGSTPVTAAATLGTPAQMISSGGGPLPIDATLVSGDAHFGAKGSIANPQALAGVALELAANIPDLGALSPLAGRPLPAIKSVQFHGNLADADGGLAKGAKLQNLALTSSAGDVHGDASVLLGQPMTVAAQLASSRLDLDAIAASTGKPLPAAEGKATATAPPPPPQRASGRGGRLFPDQPIPFALLKLLNADVSATVGVLRFGERDTKNINAHAVLQNGNLRADPLVADLPQGHLDAKISADGSKPSPPVSVKLHAPGLALRTLLAAAGMPDWASGNLEVYADLNGAGDSPHAIASTLSGYLGLALANGTIDNRFLGSVIGPLLEKANIPDILNRGGISDIRCFALRMDAQRGIGTFRALALSSSVLTMDGGGSVNLGDETLGLQLRPQAKIAGTGLVVPLHVNGPIRSPAVGLDPIGAAGANAGAVAGAVISGATPLGVIGGLLGADKLTGGGGDACAGPLAVARGQAVPAAATHENAPANPLQNAPNPANVLKQLFR